MTKTFGNNRNSVINENFYEVPNLATTSFTGSPNMNRTYQVNNNNDSVANTGNGNANGLSTTHLYEDDSKKSPLSRYLGVLFLIGLMCLSIAFLAFAIFYDEIIDSDGENAEEYWSRIQKEIKMKQNASRIDMYNNTLRKITEGQSFVDIITDQKPITVSSKPGITFANYLSGELSYSLFHGKWISDHEVLHYDSKNNLCSFNVLKLTNDIIIPFKTIQRLRLSGLSLSPDRKYFLTLYNAKRVYRYSSAGKYRIYPIND
ncbi:unnamed protein product, partial [Medioppia subpectinata]